MTRVAAATRTFSRNPVLRDELRARYPDATFHVDGPRLAGDDLIRFLKGHAKAIVSLEILDARVFAAVPELRVVSRFGVGLDTIDLQAMTRYGVRLGWTGGTNRRSVAELVICFAISLLRHVPASFEDVRQGGWRQRSGRQLSDRTVGIVGCGNVGQDLARLLRAFGCRVLAHDIRDRQAFYDETGVESVPLETLLQDSDIVTLHVPLDRSTRGMLDARRLGLMRADAILINAARGGVVDEDALRLMLEEGRIAGAALDVFAREPPDDVAWLARPDVLATPHIGGSTEEAVLAMGRAAIAGLDENRIPGDGWPDGCDWPASAGFAGADEPGEPDETPEP